MKNNEELIERTLNSLDDFNPVHAPFGFEERMKQQINKQRKSLQFIKLAVAALIIFCLANVFTVMQLSNEVTTDNIMDEAYFNQSAFPILNFTEDE